MALTFDITPSGAPPGRNPRGEPESQLEADRRRAFVAARRHTFLVRLLRLALPLAAVGVVGLYAAALLSTWNFGLGNLKVGKVEVTAEDLTMRNPSYVGTTKDGGKYEVRAKTAILEYKPDAPIKLIDIDGDMTQANSVKTYVKARRGLYDNSRGILELFDGIEIDSSNGMRARLTEATMYSRENRVVSQKPVEVSSSTGQIRGNTMTLDTAKNQAAFMGNVAVRLLPNAAPAEAPAGKPQPQQTSAFGRDQRQPVDVRSERFDLDDVKHIAIFRGNVVATQGDSVMKAPEMHVTYEGKAAQEFVNAGTPQDKPQTDAKGEATGLSRLVARTGVSVTMGTDRRVTGDVADFDAKGDTALFTGNVLVTQGKNTLQGRRLFLDRKSGRTRLESPAEPGLPVGRIAATFYQEQPPGAQPAAKSKSPAAEAEQVAASMMGTFKADPNAPMDIDAETLDVLENSRQALFKGGVKAQQGDFMVRSQDMVAYFVGQTGIGTPPPGTGMQGAQIQRIEARQKVIITSKEGQTATGDHAVFDVKSNSVLLTGQHVVVTRGKDVVQGQRLKIDLSTGMYRFEIDEKSAAAAQAAAQLPPPPKPADAKAAAGKGETPDPLANRACPPGRQCVLFYPKQAEEKAKELVKKAPGAVPGWEPNSSASPVQRGN
jgi:LPS export ABC transporter protein LptC